MEAGRCACAGGTPGAWSLPLRLAVILRLFATALCLSVGSPPNIGVPGIRAPVPPGIRVPVLPSRRFCRRRVERLASGELIEFPLTASNQWGDTQCPSSGSPPQSPYLSNPSTDLQTPTSAPPQVIAAPQITKLVRLPVARRRCMAGGVWERFDNTVCSGHSVPLMCPAGEELLSSGVSIAWPRTLEHTVATAACPAPAPMTALTIPRPSNIGYRAESTTVKRMCLAGGNWGDIDQSACQLQPTTCPAQKQRLLSGAHIIWPEKKIGANATLVCPPLDTIATPEPAVTTDPYPFPTLDPAVTVDTVHSIDPLGRPGGPPPVSYRAAPLPRLAVVRTCLPAGQWEPEDANACEINLKQVCAAASESVAGKGVLQWARTGLSETAATSCPIVRHRDGSLSSPLLSATRTCQFDGAGRATWGPSDTSACPRHVPLSFCPAETVRLSAGGPVPWSRTEERLEAASSCHGVLYPRLGPVHRDTLLPSPRALSHVKLRVTRRCLAGGTWEPFNRAMCHLSFDQSCPAVTQNVTGRGSFAWPKTRVHSLVPASVKCPRVHVGNGTFSSAILTATRGCQFGSQGRAEWGDAFTDRCPKAVAMKYCKKDTEKLFGIWRIKWPRTQQGKKVTRPCPTSRLAGGILQSPRVSKAERVCTVGQGGSAIWSPSTASLCLMGGEVLYCEAFDETIPGTGTFRWPRTQVATIPAALSCPSLGLGALKVCGTDRQGRPSWKKTVADCTSQLSDIKSVEEIKMLVTAAGSALSASAATQAVDLTAEVLAQNASIVNVIAAVDVLELAILANTTNDIEIRAITESVTRAVSDILASDLVTEADAVTGPTAPGGEPATPTSTRLLAIVENAIRSVSVAAAETFVVETPHLSTAVVCPETGNRDLLLKASSRRSQNLTLNIQAVDTLNGAAASSVVAKEVGEAQFLLPAEAVSFRPAAGSACPHPVVEFVVFANDDLFSGNAAAEGRARGDYPRIRSPVISATLRERRSFAFRDSETNMLFTTTEGTHNFSATCSFWDVQSRTWSAEGCRTIAMPDDPYRTECRCNHLTSFAVVMTPRSALRHREALSIVTFAGGSLSALCLLLTVVSVLMAKKTRLSGNMRLIILQAAIMFTFLVLFMALVKTAHRHACTAVAMALHALLVSQFVCTAAQSVFIIQRLVVIFESRTMDVIKAVSVLAIPVVSLGTVGITAGVSRLSVYNHNMARGVGDGEEVDNLCWINEVGMWYALYPIIGATVLFNIVVLLLVSCRLHRRGGGKAKRGPSFTLRFVAIFGTLLGISWVVGGIMIATQYSLALQVIFVALVPMQGIFLFLFFCVANGDIRTEWRLLFSRCMPCCVKPPAAKRAAGLTKGTERGTGTGTMTSASPLRKQSTMRTDVTLDSSQDYRSSPCSEHDMPKQSVTED